MLIFLPTDKYAERVHATVSPVPGFVADDHSISVDILPKYKPKEKMSATNQPHTVQICYHTDDDDQKQTGESTLA